MTSFSPMVLTAEAWTARAYSITCLLYTSYTLESGSEEFGELIELLSGVSLRRALRDTAPDYGPFEVDVTLYDAGGERICEADMCWGRIRMDGVSYAVGSGSAKEVNALIDAVRELVE